MSEAGARFGPWGREGGAFLELLAVAGVAVAQPAFDLLGDNASLFVVWRATRLQVVLLAACFVLVPPVALWCAEVLVGLGLPRVRPWVHAGLIGVVAGVIGIEVLKQQTELGPGALVTVAAVLALGAAWLVLRVEGARTWLRFLAVAPVVFALLFVLASPVHRVVFDPEPAAADVATGNPKRVVMVVVDELPLESLLDGTGAIDAALYPSFARLAADATWYRNHTTVAPYTEAAVPSIVSGSLPHDPDAVPIAVEYPHNIFTLLADDYEMNVHESISRLCPPSVCRVQGRAVDVHSGFRGMLVDAASIWRDFASPQRSPEVSFSGLGSVDTTAFRTGERFVRSLRPAQGPRVDFLHVLLPHFPWHYLPTGQDYAALPAHTNGLIGQDWANPEVAQLSRVRHLLQVQAADALLGRILDRLEEIDAYDDSLVVVTADHGVAFEARTPIRGVARATYPSIMWTPLFVKAPEQTTGAVDDRPARGIDVLPTIADHLEVEVPWTLDGASLLGSPRADGPRPLFRWERNALEPDDGGDYLYFDGPRGFATVLTRRAVPPSEPASLRVYRVGEYGGLLGNPSLPLVEVGGSRYEGSIDGPLRYLVVDHSAPKAPWSAIHGTVSVADERHPLAVAVNGTIAGVSWTFGEPVDGRTEFWGTLPPAAFADGRNLVQIFVIDGSPEHPVLRPVTMTPT